MDKDRMGAVVIGLVVAVFLSMFAVAAVHDNAVDQQCAQVRVMHRNQEAVKLFEARYKQRLEGMVINPTYSQGLIDTVILVHGRERDSLNMAQAARYALAQRVDSVNGCRVK